MLLYVLAGVFILWSFKRHDKLFHFLPHILFLYFLNEKKMENSRIKCVQNDKVDTRIQTVLQEI